jgi:hypothetical protein
MLLKPVIHAFRFKGSQLLDGAEMDIITCQVQF